MAEFIRDGETLILKLRTAEKLEGVHGDIHVPIASVQSVTVVEDVINAVQGIKMPGSRIPGVFAMGTFLSGSGTTFAIVHHQNKRGIKVKLRNSHFDALIVGVDDPEGVIARLGFGSYPA